MPHPWPALTHALTAIWGKWGRSKKDAQDGVKLVNQARSSIAEDQRDGTKAVESKHEETKEEKGSAPMPNSVESTPGKGTEVSEMA